MEDTQNGHKDENKPLDKNDSNVEEITYSRRSNRGKRTTILTEEQLKEDDAFWKNNPLFKDVEDEEEGEEENEDNGHDDGQIDEEDSEGDEDFEALGDEEEDTSYQLEADFDEGNNENGGEEEEADPEKLDLLHKLSANRENHFFHRPIFLKCYIRDCERSNFSYIKLPESMPMPLASHENEISKSVINNTYIGVPPKAPSEFNVTPHFPNFFETELFRLEDERYHLDSNILKYKSYIDTMEKMIQDSDSSTRVAKLEKLSKSSKIIRQKLEISEITDEIEKIKSIKAELEHDLENIIKKRDIADNNSKRKKETLYQLAIRNKEINFAEDEKETYSNSKFIEELSVKYKATLSLSENSDQIDFHKIFEKNLIFRFHEKLLYSNDKVKSQIKNTIEEISKQFKSNSDCILPSELLIFNNQRMINLAYELAITYIKNNQKIYDKEKVARTLRSMISKIFFDADYPNLDEVKDTVDANLLDEYIKELTSYNVYFKKDTSDNFDLEVVYNTNQQTKVEHIVKDRFLPGEANLNEKKISSSIYGSHYFYYNIKYFFSLYQKILLAYSLSQQDETKMNKYIYLTKAVLTEKIDEYRYYLALFNLFGSSGKYLFHIRHITHNISQTINNILYDYASEKLLEFDEFEPNSENFLKTGNMIRKRNGGSSEIKHYLYKFSFDRSQNILFIGISKTPEEVIIEASSENQEDNKEQNDDSKYNKRKEPPENIENEEPKLTKKILS